MRRRQKFLASQRGSTAVEFALLALPFVILVLGLIEFGRALHIRNGLDFVADRVQRQIILDGATTSTSLTSTARSAFKAGDPNQLQVVMSAATSDGTSYRTAQISYSMTLLVPIPMGGEVVLTTSRRVALED